MDTDNQRSSEEREKGQLPKLTGSKKQLGWAYKIRALYAEMNPEADVLQSETAAKYWIDNRRALIGAVAVPKGLPKLVGGTAKQVKYAYAIRSQVAAFFPESSLLYSQTDVSFWLANKRLFTFAVVGYHYADHQAGDVEDKPERTASQ